MWGSGALKLETFLSIFIQNGAKIKDFTPALQVGVIYPPQTRFYHCTKPAWNFWNASVTFPRNLLATEELQDL